MSLKKRIFEIAKSLYVSLPKVIPGYMGKRFRAESAESLAVIDEVDTQYGKIKYYCLGYIPLWRSQTLYTKEPEMIEWIDKMEKNSIFWDIGANIGLYSIYAGKKGLQVYAFEPSALNTFLLSKNIELNHLKDNVFLFPIAISNKNEFGFLNMTNTNLGGALNEFNKNDIESVGIGEYKQKVVFKQGMFAYSIDELIEKYNFEIPNYIKIDVDSIEDKIIYGADKTLFNEKLKGIFVELDETEDRTKKIIKFLEKRGLKLKEKRQSEMFKDSKFKNQFNYIFERLK